MPTIRDSRESVDTDELREIKEGVHFLYNKIKEEIKENYEKMELSKEKIDGTLNRLRGLYEIELKLRIGSGYKNELENRIKELESYSEAIENTMNKLNSVFSDDPLVKSTVDKKVLKSLLDRYEEYGDKAELFGSDLEEMESSIKKLEWEQNLNDKVDYLSTQMEELLQQNDDLKAQLNDLQQQNNNLNVQLNDLQQQNNNLNAQLSESQQHNTLDSQLAYSTRTNNVSRTSNSTRTNNVSRTNNSTRANNVSRTNNSTRTSNAPVYNNSSRTNTPSRSGSSSRLPFQGRHGVGLSGGPIAYPDVKLPY